MCLILLQQLQQEFEHHRQHLMKPGRWEQLPAVLLQLQLLLLMRAANACL